jgi:hypothetical protein
VPEAVLDLPALEKLDLRWNALTEPPQAPPGCFVLW